MNWRNYIVVDPAILVGKPIVKDTRLSVDFLLRLLAQGWREQDLLESYPQLSPASLQAVFAFVQECLEDEAYIMLEKVA